MTALDLSAEQQATVTHKNLPVWMRVWMRVARGPKTTDWFKEAK